MNGVSDDEKKRRLFANSPHEMLLQRFREVPRALRWRPQTARLVRLHHTVQAGDNPDMRIVPLPGNEDGLISADV